MAQNIIRVEDFTKDGQCTRCGQCCSALLPVTPKEIAAIKSYVKRFDIKPDQLTGDLQIKITCPFLRRPTALNVKQECSCAIYDVRPAICRAFVCNKNTEQTMISMLPHLDESLPAEPVNLWSVFNLTGIRIQNENIPWDEAPCAVLTTDDHHVFQLQMGRVVTLTTEKKVRHNGLIIGMTEDAVALWDIHKHDKVVLKYTDLADISAQEI